ncbi:MAG: hypothetical protein K0B07_00560 [DPANN group archaeon]|nr:hypothetical protein [DPANN group archaeon]
MKFKNLFMISLAFSFLLVMTPAFSELNCTVSNTQSFSTLVYKMSSLSNAHAELYTGSNYLYNVSCQDVTSDGVLTGINLNNNCDDAHFLNISSVTNAHVENSTVGNYPEGICLSSTSADIIYSYETQPCSVAGYQTCLGTFSSDTNAHIADCVTAPYSNYICANLTYDFTCNYGVSDLDGNCSLACGADTQCDGRAPGYKTDSCNGVGETYFIDICNSTCQFVDDSAKVCNSTGSGCNGGSLACDGYSAGQCLPSGTEYCDNSCTNETAVGMCITNQAMRKALVQYTVDPYNRKLDMVAMKCLINMYLGATCSDPKSQDYIDIANAISDSILPN